MLPAQRLQCSVCLVPSALRRLGAQLFWFLGNPGTLQRSSTPTIDARCFPLCALLRSCLLPRLCVCVCVCVCVLAPRLPTGVCFAGAARWSAASVLCCSALARPLQCSNPSVLGISGTLRLTKCTLPLKRCWRSSPAPVLDCSSLRSLQPSSSPVLGYSSSRPLRASPRSLRSRPLVSASSARPRWLTLALALSDAQPLQLSVRCSGALSLQRPSTALLGHSGAWVVKCSANLALGISGTGLFQLSAAQALGRSSARPLQHSSARPIQRSATVVSAGLVACH